MKPPKFFTCYRSENSTVSWTSNKNEIQVEMGLEILNSDVQWSVIRVDVSSTKRHILNCTRKIDFESMKFAQTGETISIAEHDFGCKWRLEEFQSLQVNFKALTVPRHG